MDAMDRLFLFDFDDTLANFSIYNSWVLKQPFPLFPPIGGTIKGAPEVLDFLKGKGDGLVMVTMNMVLDKGIKWKKLERVGMRRWFDEDNVHMVREKTPDLYRKLTAGRDPSRCYMVGNSLRHDIVPALRSGIKAIYIPRPMVKRLLPVRLPRSRDLTVLNDIRQIMGLYDRL
jgi:putative hydrolase of the HAD superfamily